MTKRFFLPLLAALLLMASSVFAAPAPDPELAYEGDNEEEVAELRERIVESEGNEPDDDAETSDDDAETSDTDGEKVSVADEENAAPRGEPVWVEAVAYSPEGAGMGEYTALGLPCGRGVIAVDPDFIPLGTRVYIPGYGEAIAADTGASIIGNIIDICFDTYDESAEFGRQQIEIYILEYPQ